MSVKVLLADSSVSNHKVVELALAVRDVELVAVTDGVTALERAKEIKPRIVLADIELPRLDGYALCEKINADPELAGTKVVLLKTSFATYDQDRASRVGARGMLEKPFSSAALLKIVDSSAAPEPVSPLQTGSDRKVEAEPVILGISDEVSFADLNIGDQGTVEEKPPADEPVVLPEIVFQTQLSDEEPVAIDSEDIILDIEEKPLEIEEQPLVIEEDIESATPSEVGLETPVEAIEEHPPEIEEPVPLAIDVQISEIPVKIPPEEEPEVIGEVPAGVFGPEHAQRLEQPLPAQPLSAPGGEQMVEIVAHNVMKRLGLAGIHPLDEETAEKLGKLLVEEIVSRMSDNVIREVAWEVIPELAERMIRETIEEITKA
jgi:CheY-like chemotaxis protein